MKYVSASTVNITDNTVYYTLFKNSKRVSVRQDDMAAERISR